MQAHPPSTAPKSQKSLPVLHRFSQAVNFLTNSLILTKNKIGLF
ncbi:hypothetical protein AO381_0867 [Moraxella catarrhalis]|nr:hypothetical protein AO381_0867 [Moraxella catarrhalis]